MRILTVTDEIYPDAIGGVGKSLMTLAAAWAAQGHQVTALVRRIDPELPPQAQISGVQIVRFSSIPRNHPLYRLYPLAVLWNAARWLYQHIGSYDVVFMNNGLYMIPIRLARRCNSIPVVYNYHASLMQEIEIGAHRGQYGSLSQIALMVGRAFHMVENWALRNSTHIVVDGHRLLNDMRSLHGRACFDGKSSVVDLGVDLKRYEPLDRSTAREKLGLPTDRTVIFTARRLVGRVGLENLISAMPGVRARHPATVLLIAGKGFLRPKLEAQIEGLGLTESVKLLGFVEEETLPVYMAASDLFALPTEFLEGFGLATIEALACGVPVVGTPVGTTPEILTPIEPKLITRDSSPSSLAETLIYWLNRPREIDKLRQACRQAAETRYNADHIASQLVMLFSDLIEKSKAPS
ncbi:MAG: glycosyltransferase family 4 protein [Anaerolineae bacterium]|nr:glycosyltransferase family 4 protein [Anaerolineae bacterium]